MSFVITHPEMLATATGDLRGLGASMIAGNATAAGPTTTMVPAAADVVSALTAAQFAAHAELYQAIGAQAAAVQELFAATLAASAGSYATTEALNNTALN